MISIQEKYYKTEDILSDHLYEKMESKINMTSLHNHTTSDKETTAFNYLWNNKET